MFHEEQTQNPLEQVLHKLIPLWRPTRERRNAILDDYTIFLQEHKENNDMMKDDPINSHQSMQDFNSEK